MFCRPLKRAMGNGGFAIPQSDDWGYHLMPAQAGFNTGLLARAPFEGWEQGRRRADRAVRDCLMVIVLLAEVVVGVLAG
jgi:hypothetical protein